MFCPSVFRTPRKSGSWPLLQRDRACMPYTSTPLLRSQRPQQPQHPQRAQAQQAQQAQPAQPAQQAQRVTPVKSVAESQGQPQPPPHHCCQHQPAGMHPRRARQWAQASKAQAQAQAAKAQAAKAQAHGWPARAGSAPRSTRPRRARHRPSWAAVSSWAMARRSQTQASASTSRTKLLCQQSALLINNSRVVILQMHGVPWDLGRSSTRQIK